MLILGSSYLLVKQQGRVRVLGMRLVRNLKFVVVHRSKGPNVCLKFSIER